MATENTTVCAAVCVASNAAAVIALLLCNSNFIMLQNTKGPNAKKGRMSLLMDGDALQAVLDREAGPPDHSFPFQGQYQVMQQHIATPPSLSPRLSKPWRGTSTKSPMRFSTAAMATDSPGVVASLKPTRAACATDAMSAGRQRERADGDVGRRRLSQVGAL